MPSNDNKIYAQPENQSVGNESAIPKIKLSKKQKRILKKGYKNGKYTYNDMLAAGIAQTDFGFVYITSRKSGLSGFESFYNALFIHVLDRFDKSKKSVTDELKNTFSHPKGWYSDSFYTWKNNFWSKLLSLLQIFPHKVNSISSDVKKLPQGITTSFDKVTVGMENSLGVLKKCFRVIKKISKVGILLCLILLAMAFAYSKLNTPIALEVYVDGEFVGAVESSEIILDTKKLLEKNYSNSIGDTYRFTGEITYSFTEQPNIKYITDTELYSRLNEIAKKEIKNAYGLYVDGALIVATENRAALERAIADISEYYAEMARFYSEQENVKISYINEIKIIPKDFPASSLVDEANVRRILGLQPIKTAEVSNDVLYDLYFKSIIEPVQKTKQKVATKSLIGIGSLNNLPEENDVVTSMSSEKLDVTIDYVLTRLETVNEDYTAEAMRIDSEEYLLGSERIMSYGKSGYRRATYEVSYQNGKEIARQLVSEQIITEAQPRIIYVGTKVPTEEELETTATGKFMLPYNGLISSKYGLRTVSKFGTREFHNAWDIPGPYGSKILASDGGKVSFVGKSQGYGLYVIINHENGFETLYAHLSSVQVKVGARVAKGQQIARMGATGRVTGVHVHYEIRKNGATVDPIQYIPDVEFKYK